MAARDADGIDHVAEANHAFFSGFRLLDHLDLDLVILLTSGEVFRFFLLRWSKHLNMFRWWSNHNNLRCWSIILRDSVDVSIPSSRLIILRMLNSRLRLLAWLFRLLNVLMIKFLFAIVENAK